MADYTGQCDNRYITLLLRTSVASQDIAANTTTISWTLYVQKSGASTSATWGSCSYTVTINGSAYSGSGSVNVAAGGSTTLLSGTTVVPHNSDGSKTVNLSASISGKIVGSLSSSETLATIPRASSLSISGGVLGQAVSLYISAASSSFTHSLTYSFGSQSGTILSYDSAGSHSWTPPLWLASQLPDAVSGVVTFTLYTWAGVGVSVGVTTYTSTLSVPSDVLPTISGVTTVESVAGLAEQFGAYVQNKSRITVSVDADGSYGSTISKCSVSFDGKTYTGDPGAALVTAAPGSSGALSLTATVYDSRGRSSSRTIAIDVQPYEAPAILSFSAYRCTDKGAALDDGDFAAVEYAYKVAGVQGKNTVQAVIEYRRSTEAGGWEKLASDEVFEAQKTVYPKTELRSDYRFDLRLTLTDFFSETAMVITLPSAEVIMDLLASGTGVAFGKVAETERALDLAWKLLLGGVEIPYVIDFTKSGEWIIKKWNNGMVECDCTHTFQPVKLEAWNGMYSSVEQGFQPLQYPVAFVEKPICTMNLDDADFDCMMLVAGGESYDRTIYTPMFQLMRPSQTTSGEIQPTVSFHVVGRWK